MGPSDSVRTSLRAAVPSGSSRTAGNRTVKPSRSPLRFPSRRFKRSLRLRRSRRSYFFFRSAFGNKPSAGLKDYDVQYRRGGPGRVPSKHGDRHHMRFLREFRQSFTWLPSDLVSCYVSTEGKQCFRIRDKLPHVSTVGRSVRASVAKPLQFIRSWRQLTGLPRNKISLVRIDPVVVAMWLTSRKSTGILRWRSPSVAEQILQSGQNKDGNKMSYFLSVWWQIGKWILTKSLFKNFVLWTNLA